LDNIPEIGNNISNANTHRLNGSVDFKKLYKYVGLEKIKFGNDARVAARKKPKSRSRSKSKRKKENSKDKKDEEDKKPKIPKKNFINQGINTLIGLATAVERAQFNYEETNGTFLPGYTNDIGFVGTLKPTTGFVFGSQAEVRELAARKGWLTLFQDFNQQYTETETRKMDYNIKIGLLKDLSLDLVGNRIYQENFVENYRVNPTTLDYRSLTPNTLGNFDISTMMIRTAFSRSDINASEPLTPLEVIV
jgi:protein involved in gliding motility SprA